MSHEMVVSAFSDACSKVTVPLTLESPRRTATWLVSAATQNQSHCIQVLLDKMRGHPRAIKVYINARQPYASWSTISGVIVREMSHLDVSIHFACLFLFFGECRIQNGKKHAQCRSRWPTTCPLIQSRRILPDTYLL